MDQKILDALDRLERAVSGLRQEWLSIKDAAQVTGLSPDHIRRAIVGGALAASNMASHDRPLYRISREALSKWMKEREAGPKPTKRRKKAGEEKPRPLPVSRHYPGMTAALSP